MTNTRKISRAILQLESRDVTADDSPFWIGESLVEPGLNQITKDGRVQPIEHMAMRVLIVLAKNADEVVSREDFLNAVWTRTAPNDEGLTQAICKLRKALGDRPGNGNVIQTIRKKGYRLVAPVSADVAPPNKTNFISFAPHPDLPGRRSIRIRINGEWLVGVTVFFLALYALMKAV